MVDLCKEWESKYAQRIDQVKRNQGDETRGLKFEFEK